MCNINLLYKTIEEKDLPFLEMISIRSFESNDDGEGFLTPKTLKTSTDKIFLSKEDGILGQKFIALHERFATHGVNGLENVQPIMKKNIVLLHNGVLNGYDHKVKSDSKLLAEDLETDTKKLGIVDAMCQNFKTASGSKSILTYDRKNKELYYYKNISTSFYVSYGNDKFFASTDKKNVEIASRFYGWDKPKYINDDCLFIIKNGRFEKIRDIDDLYMYEYYSGCNRYNDYWSGKEYYGRDAYDTMENGIVADTTGNTNLSKIIDKTLKSQDIILDSKFMGDEHIEWQVQKICDLFDAKTYFINGEIVEIELLQSLDTRELHYFAENEYELSDTITYIIPINRLIEEYGFTSV